MQILISSLSKFMYNLNTIKIGDATLVRPWSKYSQGSSAYMKRINEENEAKRLEREKEEKRQKNKLQVEKELERKKKFLTEIYGDETDEKLQEYLNVMKPRSHAKTWTNDDGSKQDDATIRGKPKIQAIAVPNKKPGGEGLLVTKTHLTFDDSDDEYEDIPKKTENTEETKNKDTNSDDNESNNDNDMDIEDNPEIEKKSTMSHMDFLRSKMRKKEDDDDKEEDDSDDDSDNDSDDDSNDDSDDDSNDDNDDDSDDGSDDSEDSEDNSEDDDKENETESNKEEEKASVKNNNDDDDEIIPDKKVDLFDSDEEEEKDIDAMLDKKRKKKEKKEEEEDIPPAQLIADTGRLFVKNLSFSCTEDDLRNLFEKFGPLSEVSIENR